MVNRSRVILAAVVIFLAGGTTGAVFMRHYAPKAAVHNEIKSPAPATNERKQDYLSKLDRAVTLTPDQRKTVEGILAASQQRIKGIWQSIDPQVKEEYRRARREISEILTPEQQEKMKQMHHGKDDKKGKPESDAEKKENRKPEACIRNDELRFSLYL